MKGRVCLWKNLIDPGDRVKYHTQDLSHHHAPQMADAGPSSSGRKKRPYYTSDYQRLAKNALKSCSNILAKRKETVDRHVRYLSDRAALRDEYQQLFQVSIDTVPVEPLPNTPIPDRKKKRQDTDVIEISDDSDQDDANDLVEELQEKVADAELDIGKIEAELDAEKQTLEGLELQASNERTQVSGKSLERTVDEIIGLLTSGGCVYQNDIPGIRAALLDKASRPEQHRAFKVARVEYLLKFHPDKPTGDVERLKRMNDAYDLLVLLRKYDPDAQAAGIAAANERVAAEEARLAGARVKLKKFKEEYDAAVEQQKKGKAKT